MLLLYHLVLSVLIDVLLVVGTIVDCQEATNDKCQKNKKPTITLIRVIPTVTFIHSVAGKSSGILSDISSGILSGISPGILSAQIF